MLRFVNIILSLSVAPIPASECDIVYADVWTRGIEEKKIQWPANLHIELRTLVGDAGIVRLETPMIEALNRIMPTTWLYNEISHIHKGKSSVLECGNCGVMELMSHNLKFCERIIDTNFTVSLIREIVELGISSLDSEKKCQQRSQILISCEDVNMFLLQAMVVHGLRHRGSRVDRASCN